MRDAPFSHLRGHKTLRGMETIAYRKDYFFYFVNSSEKDDIRIKCLKNLVEKFKVIYLVFILFCISNVTTL